MHTRFSHTPIGQWLAVVPAMVIAASAQGQPGSEWQASAWHLWRIEVEGSGLVPLDQTPGRRCGSPVWSPDGQFIAYDVLGEPMDYGDIQVAVIRADGSDGRLIGPGGIPTWSPDGTLIACQSRGLVVMNRDGRGRETLLGSAFGLRWWPRGNCIASISDRQIWLFDLATGNVRTILQSPASISHGFDVSPDGRRICFGTTGSGLGMATIHHAGPPSSIRWLVDRGIAYHASWAPDGRRVVFAWRRSLAEMTQLYLLDVDSDIPPRLVRGLDLTRQNVNPDWSPDGKTIVFSSPAPLD